MKTNTEVNPWSIVRGRILASPPSRCSFKWAECWLVPGCTRERRNEGARTDRPRSCLSVRRHPLGNELVKIWPSV